MLFEQDDKLCKQDIKSFEQNIKLSERVKKIKLECPFPGSVDMSLILIIVIFPGKKFCNFHFCLPC